MTQTGFDGTYAPANWVTSITGSSNGTIDATGAPANIVMTSSDGLIGDGSTNWTITLPCSGTLSFNWNYTTVHGPYYDYPLYSINGGTPQFFNGYDVFGLDTQSGTQTLTLNAGDVF